MEYKDIDISTYQDPPKADVVFVLGDAGYTLETAIDEIIDNSISAGAKCIRIRFFYDGINSLLKIEDDGKGMTSDELRKAMEYAFYYSANRELNDLGRFGVGLKAASCAVCNTLYVTTFKANTYSCSKIDYQEWKKENKFIYHQIVKHEDDAIRQHGTVVTWVNLKFEKEDIANKSILLNKKLFFQKIDSVRTHISIIFGLKIKSGLKIYIGDNDDLVKAWDPFFVEKSERRISQQVYIEGKNPFKIEGYILPKFQSLNEVEQNKMVINEINLNELQGLYIYRNDRLISFGGWGNIKGYNIDDKSKYARIALYFDNSYDKFLGLNFNKTKVSFPESLIRALKPLIDKLVEESRRKVNGQSKRKKEKIIKDPIWVIEKTKIGIKLCINEEQSLIKDLTSSMDKDDKKALFGLLSKEVPIGELQSFDYKKLDDSYDENEILLLLRKKYLELRNNNVSDEEIEKRILQSRPFSEYVDIVTNFFIMEGKK